MRGSDTCTESLRALEKIENFVPDDQPLRAMRVTLLQALHLPSSAKTVISFRPGAGANRAMRFMGHTLMENRHGFIVDALATPATWPGRARSSQSPFAQAPLPSFVMKNPVSVLALGWRGALA